jgi:diguanylate cyclase (GGDEF)-like protein
MPIVQELQERATHKLKLLSGDAVSDVPNQFSERKELWLSFLWLFIPISLLLAGVFYAFSKQVQKYELQTALIQEESALNNASQMTSLVFMQKLSDLMVLAEGEVIKAYLHDNRDKNWLRAAREFALFANRKPSYQQLRYIDREGMEKLRINNQYGEQEIVPSKELQDKSKRYYFNESIKLDQGEIYISPLDLNIENGVIEQPVKPTIRFATPVVDSYGVKRGILVINDNPSELLQRLSNIFEARLGEAVMLNSNGYWLLGAPQERLWGFMYGHEDTFARQQPDVWVKVNNHQKGTLLTNDGLFIFQKAYPVNLRKQAAMANNKLDLSVSSKTLSGRHWIYLSHISHDVINDHTSKHLINALIAYMLLIFVGAVVSYFFARNTLQKKLAYHQLKQLATTDALTGLANRRELEKVALREFRRAQRFERDISFMMLDLDHFKKINDTFNHVIGDEVLQHVTHLCNGIIRGQDFFVRYGGEEFVLLLPETDLSGAKQLAERIRKRVSDTVYETEKIRIPISVSIGVSSILESDDEYGEILLRADQALYQAKRDGRNQVAVYQESWKKELRSS